MNADSFTKLFGTIITSSIWSEDDKTRIMWITLLACADSDGYCSGSIVGFAAMARMTLEQAEAAMNRLESPDPHSRTPDHEGRRVLKVDGGWLLANYSKYREKAQKEERREYLKLKKREGRSKCQQMSTVVNNVSTTPSASSSVSPSEKDRESVREEEASKRPEMLRIEALFHRRETTAWNTRELKALPKEIHPDDLTLVEAYYKHPHPKDKDYRRRDLQTLLNNWNGEVDRARAWKTTRSIDNRTNKI
jgi:hypothetical protein